MSQKLINGVWDPLDTENAIAGISSAIEYYFLKLSKSVFIIFIAFSSFFQGCMYMRILCFIGSWFFLFCFWFYFCYIFYIIFSRFLFLYQFFQFICFQRQQLLLVILSSLLVAAMSMVMKLRCKLIQLPIQVYKYNFSVIQTLYIKQLTINTLILFWQKSFETTRGGKSYG